MENTELEQGCYYRINGTKRILYWTGEIWMEPVKDRQGRYGGWVGPILKQPKYKTLEKIESSDLNKHITY